MGRGQIPEDISRQQLAVESTRSAQALGFIWANRNPGSQLVEGGGETVEVLRIGGWRDVNVDCAASPAARFGCGTADQDLAHLVAL